MFCNQCGRQIPDGSVCPCQQDQKTVLMQSQPQTPQQPQYQAPQQPQYQQPQYQATAPARNITDNSFVKELMARFNLDRIVALGLAFLAFCLHFINWYTADGSFVDFGPYGTDSSMMGVGLSDFSILFVVAMIFCIINIFVFIAYVVSCIIDLGKFIPVFRGKDLSTLLYRIFFGVLAFSLIIGLIGALTGSYTPYSIFGVGVSIDAGLAAGWFITLVFTLIGASLAVKPNLVSFIINKIKGQGAAPVAPANNVQ